MRREEIRDLFIRKGFNLREVSSQDYTLVERNGETVGCIYEDSVYVAHNYPSLNTRWRTYANTQKTVVLFMRPMKMLEDAIEFLLDSPSRLDREMRDQRVENVRKYFEGRKNMMREIDRHIAILEAEYFNRRKDRTCA
jgi:hypothetical protein